MNIDKDIKNVKEIIREKTKKLKYKKFELEIIDDMFEESEIEEKIERLQNKISSLENVLKELEIKDKMIDLMSVDLALKYSYQHNDDLDEKEKVKEHFRKKVQKWVI